jgi:putative peptidoglycan lipid II flippase
MLNAVNLAFIASGNAFSSMDGAVFVFFIMTVAAVEAAVGLAMLGVPLLVTLFGYGAFGREDVLMTRLALVAYALGLTGIILVKVLAPGFYAKQNIRTPVKVALATLAITQLANVALVPSLGHTGLAAAISIGACFNAGWLWFLMKRSGGWTPEPGWGAFLGRVVLGLGAMAAALWFAMGTEAAWFAMGVAERGVRLCALVAGAAGIYFAVLRLFGMRAADFTRQP